MVEKLLTYLTMIVYLLMAYCFFMEWLGFFLRDEEMNYEQRFFSGFILIVATILWPIVVPFAYLELLKSRKKSNKIPDLLLYLSWLKIFDE